MCDLETDCKQDQNDPTSDTFALKSYFSSDAAKNYDWEVEAFRQLSRYENPYLIGFYGDYIQGVTYNLILEFADQGTLEQYFERTEPPSEEGDIIKFWKGMFGIFQALDGIHKSTTRRLVGAGGKLMVVNGYVIIYSL